MTIHADLRGSHTWRMSCNMFDRIFDLARCLVTRVRLLSRHCFRHLSQLVRTQLIFEKNIVLGSRQAVRVTKCQWIAVANLHAQLFIYVGLNWILRHARVCFFSRLLTFALRDRDWVVRISFGMSSIALGQVCVNDETSWVAKLILVVSLALGNVGNYNLRVITWLSMSRNHALVVVFTGASHALFDSFLQ